MDAEYRELLKTALTWTDGGARKAQQLVERWYQGKVQGENIRAPRGKSDRKR